MICTFILKKNKIGKSGIRTRNQRFDNIGFPGQIRKFISQLYFLCIQIRRFWHYGVNLLF